MDMHVIKGQLMKLFGIQYGDSKDNINFKGTRTLKNTVVQLARNNRYSLSEPNQRYIANSINELGAIPGENNIRFLLNIAAKEKYNTNIKLTDAPKHDWKTMLLTAAASALALTPIVNKTEFANKIQELSKPQELSEDEKDILKARESLLNAVDLEQIKNETVGGIKDFQRNLDYFIVSSETTVAHKKYVLKRLNYFMSDKYKINPQLKDKKSIAVAEMVNDMAIFTPGHKIPNIKAVNQKQHGICAAISIVRKKLAYEDKPNYVDSIISELDASDFIKVYERSELGSGKRTRIKKVPVDFEAALSKGYRIIDASTTQWMQLAGRSGYSGITYNEYNPFDKDNFDVNSDSFFNAKFEDPELCALQEYYQALLKANSLLENYKANKIESKLKIDESRRNQGNNLKTLQNIRTAIMQNVGSAELASAILNLQCNYSDEINSSFEYIKNEEEVSKKNKIKNYILSINPSFKIDDAKLDKIYDLADYYHKIEETVKSTNKNKRGIARATELYKIAAANRYQFSKSLRNESTIKQMMIDENVTYREKLIENIIDLYISKIKNNTSDSQAIIDSISSNIGQKTLKRNVALASLMEMKRSFHKIHTDKINKVFKSICLTNSKHALSAVLSSIKECINNGNTEVLLYASERLGVKNSQDAVISALDNHIKQIDKGKSDAFDYAFDKLGNSSKIEFLKGLFNDFLNKISCDENGEFLNDFISVNNLNLDKNPDAIQDKINELQQAIINIEYFTETYSSILTTTDKDGNILFSPNPSYVIMKKLENDGTIISAKDLKELQIHLDSIKKERSADEFSSRRDKLRDKSLYKFSKTEKAAMSIIENNINAICRHVQKQLTYLETYLKNPLEELKRMIGTDMGHWWVGKDGSSGLYTGQQIRVLEYITGRPHYKTNDLKEAIETIKTSPYSGISSSSVYHNSIGMHAQYIADIAPVEISVNTPAGDTKKKIVDVLFQDNTWGASEHENTWVDSHGLVRTDYSDNRGGTLGYITDNNYRNGNFVHRILGEMILKEEPANVDSKIYKRMKKDAREGFEMRQYDQIILDGRSPKAKDIADSIHDTVFLPSTNQIRVIKKFATGLTEAQIKSKINALKYTAANWEDKFDSIMERIMSGDNSSSAIRSKEDYDKLPDNDILKVKCEKAALKKNYKLSDYEYKIAKVNNVSDLNRFKRIQKQRAIKDLKYSFGKDVGIVAYLVDSLNGKDLEKIDNILKKYNIQLSDEEIEKIFDTYEINDADFNGSMKQTIKKVSENLRKNINEVVKNPAAQNELASFMQRLFANKLYFRTSDINNAKIQKLIEFIDRIYNPEDNAALARIFRKIQDMPAEEFKREIISKITNEELGIKNYTGYDILKAIQQYDKIAESGLRNVIWVDELYNTTDLGENRIEYEPHKLYRKQENLQKYNFDTSYIEMKNDLSLLNIGKLFDKYKARNLDKYGVYPAYPKIEYMPESMFRYGYDCSIGELPKHIDQIKNAKNLRTYFNLSEALKEFSKTFNANDILNEDQFYELNRILGQISTSVYDDETQSEVYEAVMNAMEIEQNSKFGQYLKYIKTITSKIDAYKKACSIEDLEKQIAIEKSIVSRLSDMFIKSFIRSRYQDAVYKTLQLYKRSLIRDEKTSDGKPLSKVYEEKLWDEFHKYHILQEPEEALEKYVLSLAEDSPMHEYNSSFEILLHRALGFAQLYDVQTTLMSALDKGIETDVKSAFNTINIEFFDGTVLPMGSNEIIYSIVQSLILDYQEDTALLFLDKFGLNEQYVKYTVQNFNLDETKRLIDESVDIQDAYTKFTNIYQKTLEKTYDNLKNGADPIKTADDFKKEIAQSLKSLKLNKKYTQEFLKSIDGIKDSCLKNLTLNPIDVYNTILTKSVSEFEYSIQSEYEQIANSLNACNSIIDIVNRVNLNEKSKAAKLREEFNDKFNELIEYQNNRNNLQEL